jgi:3-oxoacyl-[acyl-carrier protein] reductase
MIAVVEDIEKKYGPIEVLVCSAGVAETKLGIGVTVEDLESMSRSNLHTAVVPMRIVARLMARRSSGRIIAVSSVGAGFGLPKHLAYNASKAAVIGAARTFARELATRGVTVNVVTPGPIDTEMLRQGERVEEYISSYVPMSRAGTTEEVAAAVSFLAARDAGFVTGAVIPVDGGMTMCW